MAQARFAASTVEGVLLCAAFTILGACDPPRDWPDPEPVTCALPAFTDGGRYATWQGAQLIATVEASASATAIVGLRFLGTANILRGPSEGGTVPFFISPVFDYEGTTWTPFQNITREDLYDFWLTQRCPIFEHPGPLQSGENTLGCWHEPPGTVATLRLSPQGAGADPDILEGQYRTADGSEIQTWTIDLSFGEGCPLRDPP